jgi:hypothetical protein
LEKPLKNASFSALVDSQLSGNWQFPFSLLAGKSAPFRFQPPMSLAAPMMRPSIACRITAASWPSGNF